MLDSNESHHVDYKKLQAWIYKYFNEADINATCFALDIDFDNIRQNTRELTTIALIQYCKNRGLLITLAEHVKSERPLIPFPDDIICQTAPAESGNDHIKTDYNEAIEEIFDSQILYRTSEDSLLIPFTNREDEIRQIMSYYASGYYLLDGPAGYGKTELLKELAKRFTENGWDNVYVPVRENESFEALVYTLADKFNITTQLKKQFKQLPLEHRLSAALKGTWLDAIKRNQKKEGLVLLLDFDKKPSPKLIRQLVDKLVPAMQVNLPLEYAKVKHNPFRVILTGRYLADKKEIRMAAIRPKVLQLSPFVYDVVRDSVGKYLTVINKLDTPHIPQLAAHLLYLTGGHPGGIAQTLNLYGNANIIPDVFLQFMREKVWSTIIRNFVFDIQDGIDKSDRGLFEILENLSVFRYIDHRILENTIDEESHLGFTDQHDLADKLTETYLLTWNTRFLQDGITRRLLAIKFRNEHPPKFQESCQRAMTLCAQRFQEPNLLSPEIWTIEYLFQFLQQYANDINEDEARREIGQRFLDEVVPQALRLFISERNISPKNQRVEKHALSNVMEGDWEFRFTVNYYLRADQYNDEPFAKLQQKIDDYFDELMAN